MISFPKLFALSESVIVIQFDAPARFNVQQICWRLTRELTKLSWVDEVVPGMNNVSLQLNPLQLDVMSKLDEVRRIVTAQLDDEHLASVHGLPSPLIEIPVVYGGDAGPDLEFVAASHGLSPREVVALHTQAEYQVYFLGFQPGFAYLGGLPEQLATPRRAEPRLAVPAGAVGIGGAQTGIYPAQSPGGWQLIGRTALTLFDLERSPPGLLQSGDRVRFIAQPEGVC